jgi:Sec-independent protein translocase protein TatA
MMVIIIIIIIIQKFIPVIIGATGTISKSLRQYLSDIPGKHEIKEMKKKQTNKQTKTKNKQKIKQPLARTHTAGSANVKV